MDTNVKAIIIGFKNCEAAEISANYIGLFYIGKVYIEVCGLP